MNKLFLGTFLLGLTAFESALFDFDELSGMDKKVVAEKYNNVNVENEINNIFNQESNKATLMDMFKAIEIAIWRGGTTVIAMSINKLDTQEDWVKDLQNNIRNILSRNELFMHDLKQKIFDFDDIGFSYTTRGKKPFILRLYKNNYCYNPISFTIDYENDFSVKDVRVPVLEKAYNGAYYARKYVNIELMNHENDISDEKDNNNNNNNNNNVPVSESALFYLDSLPKLGGDIAVIKYDDTRGNAARDVFSQESTIKTLETIREYMLENWSGNGRSFSICISDSSPDAEFVRDVLSKNKNFLMDLKRKIFDFDDIMFSYEKKWMNDDNFIIRLLCSKLKRSCIDIVLNHNECFCPYKTDKFTVNHITVPLPVKGNDGECDYIGYSTIKI